MKIAPYDIRGQTMKQFKDSLNDTHSVSSLMVTYWLQHTSHLELQNDTCTPPTLLLVHQRPTGECTMCYKALCQRPFSRWIKTTTSIDERRVDKGFQPPYCIHEETLQELGKSKYLNIITSKNRSWND